MRFLLSLLTLPILLSVMPPALAQKGSKSPGNDIVGHVIAGYQGWFAAPGDGSPVGNLPAGTGNYHVNYETYPDLREFPDSEQFAPPASNRRGGIVWNAFPNGNPARLFSSDRDFTTNLHARWMKQYGVDVAAIQRFSEAGHPGINQDQKNDLTRRMMHACEKNGVKFYIEFDTSGSGRGDWGGDFADLKRDWTNFAVGEKIIASTAYARQRGKPVVELWGMGLHDNGISTDPAQWKPLVQWFQSQGVYVIAGTSTSWRTVGRDAVPGFDDAYAACDAINPWLVGRVSRPEAADEFARNTLQPDLAWCRDHHIDYIPCVYVGTSFYNSNHRTKNVIPRQKGELMWREWANLRASGVSTCFVSMLDEYNEATAIAKSAEDASMVPANQWFLTLDADGGDLSADFYLRLTRDGARMMKGETPLQWKMPTSYRSEIFRTSFEDGQAGPLSAPNVKNADHLSCAVSGDRFQRGSHSLLFAGTPSGGAPVVCKLFDVSHDSPPLSTDSLLYYWLAPQNENGRFVALDLQFTDGTTLSAANLTDQNGRALTASAGHSGSIPLNVWTVVTVDLSRLSGKRITSIRAVYDHRGGSSFRCFLDDIEITR